MKHPDDQWFGRQCKENKLMKLFCLYVMTQVQGNLLSIDYVSITHYFSSFNHFIGENQDREIAKILKTILD